MMALSFAAMTAASLYVSRPDDGLPKRPLPKAQSEIERELRKHDPWVETSIEQDYSNETKEARFAKAIDSMDALIHFLDYKDAWKTWTMDMVIKYHGKNIEEFPSIKEAFEAILEFTKENGYYG